MTRRKVGVKALRTGSVLLGTLFVYGCGGKTKPATTPATMPPVSASEAKGFDFADVTQEAGIRFKHYSGATGKKYMPETVGSGVAFLDYNQDGKLDLFFVNSTDWASPNAKPHYPALYRNDGNGKFTDVTQAAGLKQNDYGMGATVGDYNNDGFPDIYLTNIGVNRLYRNNGNGTFTDVAKTAGVQGIAIEPGGVRWKWSSSAAWCDINKDGIPDLFVCNYVRWTPQTDVYCTVRGGNKKSYCAPNNFEGTPAILYLGRKDGTFEDASAKMGIAQHTGKGFGVIADDFNGDGWTDLAVTNDTSPNFLYLNQAGKGFKEVGVENGFAYPDSGQPKAGMGIDLADFEGNGKPGLLTGNFAREALSLYVNDGTGMLHDDSYPRGVAQPSLMFLTFGLFFFDADLDGWADIFTANGHIDDFVQESDAMITYQERSLLFRNLGKGKFVEVGAKSGAAITRKVVGRGCAWGDFDGDGDPDIALISNNEGGFLFRNNLAHGKGWLGIQLRGTKSTRDGWGARVRVTAGGRTQTLHKYGGGSFVSTNQSALLVGLNGAEMIEKLEIDWLSGETTRLQNIAAGRYIEITEGQQEAKTLAAK